MNRMFYLLCAALCLLIATPLSAVNHMDIISTLTDDFNGAEFGASMVSMDFNGDGYQDLIVKSHKWNPTGVYNDNLWYGKIYFYWGGPGFDNVADFTIEGQYHYHYGSNYGGGQLCNAGDMNGDGIDDLAIPAGVNESNDDKVVVFFGRAVPQSTPDIEVLYQGKQEFALRPLGDINGDGLADLSIMYNGVNSHIDYTEVWDDVYGAPHIFRSSNNSISNLTGIGDINNDSYDDCYMSFAINGLDFWERRIVIFYGDELYPMADSLVIMDYVTEFEYDSRPVGDVNNDGYADYIGYHANLWIGAIIPNPLPFCQIVYNTPYWEWYGINYGAFVMAVYGDFNIDGYDDIICSSHDVDGGAHGQAGLWLGGANVNGTMDLRIYEPSNSFYMNFGFAKAAGDFNGDGLCDVAISAPYWGVGGSFLFSGKVSVFSGNTELADTTVANEDELAPAIGDDLWQINLYPNPCPKANTAFNIELKGDAYQKNADISYELYNIKGQKQLIKSITNGEMAHKSILVDTADLSSGIYLIAIRHQGRTVQTKRMAIY